MAIQDMQISNRIGRRIKLRDLNIFLAVANERSMSKAAVQMAIAQPAISKAIGDMEHTLGAPLFDRGPRGVELTLYGRALMKRSVAIFDELRQGVLDIESLLDPSVGEARVGSTGASAAGIVPAIIETLTRGHPRVSIQVVHALFDGLMHELRERNIDLAIGRGMTPIADEDIASEVLFHERLVIVAGMESKWAKRRKITLAELLDEPWTFPPIDSIPGLNIVSAFQSTGLNCPRPSVPTDSVPTIVHLLASGRFLTVLPESMVHFSAKNLRLKVLPVKWPDAQRPVVLLTMKNRTLSPVAQLFIDTARTLSHPFALRK
jgi:DNA-binding transcriptional LysR family regulator